MSLSEFILSQLEAILDEWEKFARNIPVAAGMPQESLRDHARGILETIAADLLQAQTAEQQSDKARGCGPVQSVESQAQLHGHARVSAGFSINETMAEYRALRACVLRMYAGQGEHDNPAVVELTRFNEAIDQALTESLARFADIKDRQRRLFDALLSTSPDLNYIFDSSGKIVYANKAFAHAVGKPLAELAGADFCNLCAPFEPDIRERVQQVMSTASTYRGELLMCDGEPGQFAYEYLLVPVIDPQGRREAVAGTARDITERKAAEERIRRSANFDHLTGLPNRSLFRERLDHEMRHVARTGLPLALLFIDLDGFKGVNDRLGHAAGDQLLQLVAARVAACVRDTDTVARLGGDEFTVILTDVTVPPHVHTVCDKILTALSSPFRLKAAEVSISGSIGITLYPQDSATTDDLVRHADAAMYAAKNAGRNCYRFFADLA